MERLISVAKDMRRCGVVERKRKKRREQVVVCTCQVASLGERGSTASHALASRSLDSICWLMAAS